MLVSKQHKNLDMDTDRVTCSLVTLKILHFDHRLLDHTVNTITSAARHVIS